MVDVVVIGRFSLQDGYSDPLRLVSLTDDYLRMLKTGEYSEELLLGRVIDSAARFGRKFIKRKEDVAKDLREILKSMKLVDFNGYITDSGKAFDACLDYFRDRCNISGIELVNDQVHYVENVDTVCIVTDMDKRPEGEYERLLRECSEKGYRLFVTNPKFELWILLHFGADSIGHIPEDPETAAKMIDSRMRQLKIGKKTDFTGIIQDLRRAMKNSENFERSLEELEHGVGTNIPELFRELGYGGNCKQG